MSKETALQLKWEKSTTGLHAIRYEGGRIQTPNTRGVAYKKAWDVAFVRASFRGESIGLEPYVRLWIGEGKNATGLTVLMHRYPRDEVSGPLPDVCIRWAEWRSETAIEDFIAAEDKQRYVRDELPLQCVLRFYRSPEIGIDQLMERTARVLADGVSFTEDDRPELDRREVTIEFCDGLLFYQFSFSPGRFSSGPLEEVVQLWVDYARSLQGQHDYAPDQGFQIAYRESLWEHIARYDESR